MNLPNGLLVAWYGDDFTGSAAVMEALAFAGLPAVLFLEPPTPEQRAHFPEARGIGIASTARTQSPAWMETHLPPIFAFLASLKAPITHYKVCSTLDSSSEIGSIGRATDIALSVLTSRWVPVLLAAPVMRRYQAFGHLFAGAPGGVFRLDRHPVMSRHPVTPMDESDVAAHLRKQTQKPMGLLDLEALASPETARAALEAQLAAGMKLLSLDAIDTRTLAEAGRLIWENRGEGLFVVGSQGVEYALVEHWGQASDTPASAGVAEKLIAISGSVSEITAGQIAWALGNGFVGIPFDACAVVQGKAEAAIEAAVVAALHADGDPLIFTARGPDDPAVAAFRQASAHLPPEEANRQLGEALGKVLDRVLRQSGARRAVISGGDTSGHATRQLGVFALTALAPITPGGALCRAHSDDPHYDGLELALKGGQMGSTDYLGRVKHGGGS